MATKNETISVRLDADTLKKLTRMTKQLAKDAGFDSVTRSTAVRMCIIEHHKRFIPKGR